MEQKDTVKKTRFLDSVSVYGLEFAVAMITLIISVSVLSFATFALCNYFAYDDVGSGRGYFALWSSASTIVWVPVALIFYLRSRAYIGRHPEVSDNPVQRVFTIIYQVTMILTIISFAVAAVYAALTSLVRPEDTKDVLLAVALPSAISALLFSGALVAFFRRPVVRRRTFAILFLLVSALIIIPTIVVSILTLRAQAVDELKSQDLGVINAAVESFDRENDKTPANIAELKSYIDEGEVRDRLNRYRYERVDDTRYRLCATFSADSRYTSSRISESEYRTYANFNSYQAGETCYKLRTSYSSVYDYDDVR